MAPATVISRVLYVLGKLGQETTLKEDATIDTNIDSPYNDYVHKGLMPGPVDSPSLSAIEAVINPSSTKVHVTYVSRMYQLVMSILLRAMKSTSIMLNLYNSKLQDK
ncbi:hypothetical protein STHE1630_01385 [Streptococcus thermophilus CNCM I-1630]|nr:hypothetical protein STHE1630_01385 [Streptococcus thermophilus CNCM I-1630]